jgi:circadian clock protein KaiC
MAEKMISTKKDIVRIKTYIEGLDEQMEGGIPEGHVVLICGVSGTMKSSVTFNVLYNEALKGKTCMYLSLEQSATSLLNHMINLGMDLSKISTQVINDFSELNDKIEALKKAKGGIIISDLGAIRKEIKTTKISPSGDWMNVIKNLVKRVKDNSALDHFVLDSLSALYVLSNFENPRQELFYMFEFFRDLGITSFFISEMPLARDRYGEYEIEDFLADGVIKLDLVERQRKVTREITVVKMRTTKCNVDVFSMEFSGGKFKALYGGQPALI